MRPLLAAALPSAYALRDVSLKNNGDVSHPARSGLAESAAARWLRPSARARWELKHRDPATTTRLLAALRAVASRATAERAPATHRSARRGGVRARAVLRARAASLRGSGRARASREARAVRAPAPRRARRGRRPAGCLPALSPATIRAVAHAAPRPPRFKRRRRNGKETAALTKKRTTTDDGRRRDARRRRRRRQRRGGSLALSTSFFAAVLTGAPEWDRTERVAGAAARALVDLGDAGAWAGAALAWGAVAAARRRARASDTRGAEGRAVCARSAWRRRRRRRPSAPATDPKRSRAGPGGGRARLLASALTLAYLVCKSAASGRDAESRANRARGEAAKTTKKSLCRGPRSTASRFAALRAAPRWAPGRFRRSPRARRGGRRRGGGRDARRGAAASRVADFYAPKDERREPVRKPSRRRLEDRALRSRHGDERSDERERESERRNVRLRASHRRGRAGAPASAGAARAASAARDAARAVQDAFD